MKKKGTDTHQTEFAIMEPAPAEVSIGADLRFTIAVRCASGCDLTGGAVQVLAGDTIVASGALAAFSDADGRNESAPFIVRAPAAVGPHRWRVLFPRQTIGGMLHEAVSADVMFNTVPCKASLAVWGVPQVVLPGQRFTIKVGGKSASNFVMSGAVVEILDESGVRLAGGTLGDTPWPETTALYWTEIELVAPQTAGVSSRSVAIAAAALESPHHDTAGRFTFATAHAPEHAVTVQVTQKENGKPIADAQIRVGAYGAATDASGRARVEAPKGTYEVFVWKSGFLLPRVTVDLQEDVQLSFVGEVIHRDNPWTQLV